jgi:hypothetical protein
MLTSRSVPATVSTELELDVNFASLEQEAGDLATLVYDVVSCLSSDGRGQLHRWLKRSVHLARIRAGRDTGGGIIARKDAG